MSLPACLSNRWNMTEEQIKQRMEMLKQQLEQLKANSNAIMGALQDCEYWLQQINAQSKENLLQFRQDSGVEKEA